jgi:hypothetical protein
MDGEARIRHGMKCGVAGRQAGDRDGVTYLAGQRVCGFVFRGHGLVEYSRVLGREGLVFAYERVQSEHFG